MYWGQDYSPQCLSVLTEHLWLDRVPTPPWRARHINAGVRLAGFQYVLHHRFGRQVTAARSMQPCGSGIAMRNTLFAISLGVVREADLRFL
jgi:hypothetical protein